MSKIRDEIGIQAAGSVKIRDLKSSKKLRDCLETIKKRNVSSTSTSLDSKDTASSSKDASKVGSKEGTTSSSKEGSTSSSV